MGTPFRHKTVPAEGSEPAARASDGGAGLASLREQPGLGELDHLPRELHLHPVCSLHPTAEPRRSTVWGTPFPTGPPSTGSCCKPASRHLVPVLYLDDYNTLVISSVYLTRSCSCTPQINPHHPTN
ncbi:unnamed protein product [Coregonus sp. 'balchen']|nr:unnamed protein product [Coregonus sp. 'balchen']